METKTIHEPTIFYFPGEGLIATILEGGIPKLFTRQGLEHRLVERTRALLSVDQEERALQLLRLQEPNLIHSE